ncbi:MAG: hypothetical protein HC780_23615 [Leptolyngbyaceae cyanobacterium CSU_1_3]|nr:hypothetical protein [Leptolyngbyaceae cyanobacterium CSU_1_3]
MAEDIGPELVPFLKPEDLLKGLDAEKQRRLLALVSVEERLSGLNPKQLLAHLSIEERLSDISLEELIKQMSPEQRKSFLN